MYGTPAITRIAATDVVITPNGDCVRVADGRILATKMGKLEYPSPLVRGRVVFFVGQPAVAQDEATTVKTMRTNALEDFVEAVRSVPLPGGLDSPSAPLSDQELEGLKALGYL